MDPCLGDQFTACALRVRGDHVAFRTIEARGTDHVAHHVVVEDGGGRCGCRGLHALADQTGIVSAGRVDCVFVEVDQVTVGEAVSWPSAARTGVAIGEAENRCGVPAFRRGVDAIPLVAAALGVVPSELIAAGPNPLMGQLVLEQSISTRGASLTDARGHCGSNSDKCEDDAKHLR